MKKLQSRAEKYNSVSRGLVPVLYLAVSLIIFGGATAITINAAQVESIVRPDEADAWLFFTGKEKPPIQWTGIDFDANNWLHGVNGAGYGSSKGSLLNDMRGNYFTVYARRQFIINNIYAVTGMVLSMTCDGSFIAYLNGIEIIRNEPDGKSVSIAAPQSEQLDIGGFIHELLPGKNVISVSCSNDDTNSIDFSFVPSLEILEEQGGHAQ